MVGNTQSQVDQCADDAMLVFDGSGSMAAMGFNGLNTPRINDARVAVGRAMPRITSVRKVGLIIYGPGPHSPCSNVDLRFRPQKNSASQIIAEVDSLSPEGETPLSAAVDKAAAVLDYQEKSGVVVLVTDGKETCGGTPCRLASRLAASGNITVHVIGFKVRGEFFQWESQGSKEVENAPTISRCLADLTGGKYISTESVDELVSALRDTLTCPLIGFNMSGTPDKPTG